MGNLNNSAEVVISSSDPKQSQTIVRAVKAGKLRKLAPRLYTSNMEDKPYEIVRRHRYFILARLFPEAVISHRSALEGGFAKDNSIVLTYRYTKKIVLPGITVRLIQGHGPFKGDTRFLETLSISSRPRALLENFQVSRSRGGLSKTLSKIDIESRLDKIIRVYGEEELNRLRDEAKHIASHLDLQSEFVLLDKVIGSLLGTKDEKALTSAGEAGARGLPYDPNRIELFTVLAAYLNSAITSHLPNALKSAESYRHFSFFEAYFSNFIEGTEFEVSEAQRIVFENQIIPHRSDDSHDILGTYQLASSETEMNTVPNTFDEFLSILKYRHSVLLEARREMQPGQFKDKINRAGNTVFVKPDEVIGTLKGGYELSQSLDPGIERAVFMMFLVSEVHPFLDGNGRIARIMMNAELSSAKQCKIIIPTVYREDYLLTIRQLSRAAQPEPYVNMLEKAQSFCAALDFSDYETVLADLQRANAFARSSEAKLVMPKTR